YAAGRLVDVHWRPPDDAWLEQPVVLALAEQVLAQLAVVALQALRWVAKGIGNGDIAESHGCLPRFWRTSQRRLYTRPHSRCLRHLCCRALCPLVFVGLGLPGARAPYECQGRRECSPKRRRHIFLAVRQRLLAVGTKILELRALFKRITRHEGCHTLGNDGGAACAGDVVCVAQYALGAQLIFFHASALHAAGL